VSLFTEDALADDLKGRDDIARRYASTFNSTASRRVSLTDIHWFAGETGAWGVGRYQLKIRARVSDDWRLQRGTITFYVAKIDGRPVITAMNHTTEAR